MTCHAFRRARRAVLIAGMLAGAPSSPATAQRSAYAAGLSSELDSATTAALLRELERASGRGLPTEPLLAKAREGRLKRAPGARIRQAVAALSLRLDSARMALGPDAETDVLVAGAEALAAGANADALRAVRAAASHPSPGVPLGVPLGALAQLVASGVPPARATGMVVELLRRRVPSTRMVAFGNAVESDVASGRPPDDAALFRLRALNGVQSLNSTTLSATAGAPPPPPPPNNGATQPAPPPTVTSPRRRP
jgi:hypothetical protein